jgi:hypothetical protein
LLKLLCEGDLGDELQVERDGAAWSDLLGLLRHHRLLGLAATGFSPWRALLPARVSKRLDRARTDGVILNAAVARGGERLLLALQARGVPAVPLKGPWLAERIGADPAHRPTCDVDLLVPEDSGRCATMTLGELGYRYAPDVRRHDRPVHLKFCAGDERPLVPRVELHTRLVADDTSAWMERLWGRAEQRAWRGLNVWALSPVDLTLALTQHARRHGWAHFCHLVDIALAVRAEGERLDWELLVAQAREASIASSVRRSLVLAVSLCGIVAPAPAIRALDVARARCLLGDALLSRRGVLRPRSDLVVGPYSGLLDLISDDDGARRRAILWRAVWRPAPGGQGIAGRPAWSLLRKAWRLGIQGTVAFRPFGARELPVAASRAFSSR